MPILSVFFGIIVRMWHAIIRRRTSMSNTRVSKPSSKFVPGKSARVRLPKKAAAIVKEWCLRHQEELLANWEHAQRFEPLERIPGADQDD